MTSLSRTRNRNLNDLQREMDRVFGRFFPSSTERDSDSSSQQAVWAPRTDLVETEDAYRIHLDVPGVSKDELKINYQDNQLTVSGERASNRTDDEEYVRVERAFGPFYRSFTLPRTVNAENIEAAYDNGVLTITVPKTEDVKPRQIEIQ